MNKLKNSVFLLVFLGVLCLDVQAQTTVGVDGGTLAVSPSHTVTDGTTLLVTGNIKNTGGSSITGNIAVNLAIGSGSVISIHSTSNYSVTNFLPASLLSFTVSDIASVANQYNTGGGIGTTIIVWAIFGSPGIIGTTSDSATTVIYIDTTGVNSINEMEDMPVKFKNPISERVILDYDPNLYNCVELVNSEGQIVLNAIENNVLLVEYLSKGLYFIKFYHRNGHAFITKKVLIE